jgi:hypothetical protein
MVIYKKSSLSLFFKAIKEFLKLFIGGILVVILIFFVGIFYFSLALRDFIISKRMNIKK